MTNETSADQADTEATGRRVRRRGVAGESGRRPPMPIRNSEPGMTERHERTSG